MKKTYIEVKDEALRKADLKKKRDDYYAWHWYEDSMVLLAIVTIIITLSMASWPLIILFK